MEAIFTKFWSKSTQMLVFQPNPWRLWTPLSTMRLRELLVKLQDLLPTAKGQLFHHVKFRQQYDWFFQENLQNMPWAREQRRSPNILAPSRSNFKKGFFQSHTFDKPLLADYFLLTYISIQIFGIVNLKHLVFFSFFVPFNVSREKWSNFPFFQNIKQAQCWPAYFSTNTIWLTLNYSRSQCIQKYGFCQILPVDCRQGFTLHPTYVAESLKWQIEWQKAHT